MQMTPESILSSCFTQLETAQGRSSWKWELAGGEAPPRVIASFFPTSGELGAAQQIPTTELKVQGSE